MSVQFWFVLSEMLQLDTHAIDFVLAFPQADLDTPVYMYLPAGIVLMVHPKAYLMCYVFENHSVA